MRDPGWRVATVVGLTLAGIKAGLRAEPELPPVQPAGVPAPSPLLRVLPPGVVGPLFDGRGVPEPPPRPAKPAGCTTVAFQTLPGLRVARQSRDGSFGGGDATPREADFEQGRCHRLRLTLDLAAKSAETYHATLAVAPATPRTAAFLRHCSVPLPFTPEEFAEARAGKVVVKALYLPDPASQEFGARVDAEEVSSTRLEPGTDPVEEAGRRGAVLVTVRLGHRQPDESPKAGRPAPAEGSAPPAGR